MFSPTVSCEINFNADQIVGALLAMPAASRVALLDGGSGDRAASRYLIAGFDPFETIEVRGDRVVCARRDDGGKRRTVQSSDTNSGGALAVLDERLKRYLVENSSFASPVAGGACVATLAYELAHAVERFGDGDRMAERIYGPEPDAVLAFYDALVVYDYQKGRAFVASVGGRSRVEEACRALRAANGGSDDRGAYLLLSDEANALSDCVHVSSDFTRDEYLAAVRRVKEHIYAGDIYQANLTQGLTCERERDFDAARVFARLRREHPAPFAAYVVRSRDVVVSASPERFLRVSVTDDEEVGRLIEAWPIKGTRRRGRGEAEDARLRAELLASGKDRAENVMIVDLLRNDLGRVCRYGTVRVAELCALEEHPTLFHLVSRVRGRLRDEVGAAEILRAAFPCGSITGAPKIRAMQIIDAIERRPRGLSMGAVGYFSFDGAIDLNVAIRTAVVAGRTARFRVGGGVVAESDPQAEYEESLLKARALLRALGKSEAF